MAKEAGKKRKLDVGPDSAYPKRRKPSIEVSSNDAGSETVREAVASPQVLIEASEAGGIPKKTRKGNPRQSTGKHLLQDTEQGAVLLQPTPEKTNTQGSLDPPQTKTRKRKSQQYTPEMEKAAGEEKVVVQRPGQKLTTTTDKVQRALEKKARRRAAKEPALAAVEAERGTVISTDEWTLSSTCAGRFLDHDPIFVLDENDEECLIAASPGQLQLLSVESSLVLRTHDLPEGRAIICFTRNPHASQSVDIAYDNGSKITWNWITSETTNGTFPGQEIAVAMSTAAVSGESSELYYVAQSGSDYVVVGERRFLYTTQRPLTSIQVLHEGAYIVCLSAAAVVVGARKDPSPQSDYVWVELPSQIPLRCVEARLVFKNSTKKQQSKRPDLMLAVGDAEGQIRLYSDLGTMFTSKIHTDSLAPRVLHWHRESVSSVKFSRDGTYLISGGRETVLVLWQLETGKRQYIPHLTAEIERIVVNAQGTRYALQMGDNSIMILSTSELKPVANFAGLQLPTSTEQMEAIGIVVPKANAILHPQKPYQLLLSVPSTQPKEARDVATRPFLQTFDIRNSRHIARQALARNNVTDFNISPEQTPIISPDITQLALSADGQWLATVDEWVQPGVDMEHVVSGAVAADVHHVRKQQETRHEVHLKFWRWNEVQGLWTLSTRVDAPHNRTISGDVLAGPGCVLRLVSDPVANSFATIGQDNSVKIWGLRMRTRHGAAIRDSTGTDGIDWVCKRTVSLPLPGRVPIRADSPMEGSETADMIANAHLAYSPDGSMLACTQISSAQIPSPEVSFISTTTGMVVSSRTGLIPPEQELVDMAFVDRYFISLTTESVRTWDLVEDKHQQTRNIAGDATYQEYPMLAVNRTENTFAVISYEPVQGSSTFKSKVQVYDTLQPETLFETELPARPAALLAGNGARGFTILFEDGTIRTLSSAMSIATSKRGFSSLSVESSSTLSVADLAEITPEAGADDAGVKPLALQPGEYSTSGSVVEDDRPVVRPEQLAAIFDVGQSFAMAPVREMFQSVAKLFAREPLRHVEEDRMEVMAH